MSALKSRLIESLPKNLMIDLFDIAVVHASTAHELIEKHTKLKGKRARAAEGQIRFRTVEQAFEEVCAAAGGIALPDGVIPGTKLKFYQPFIRFGEPGSGVILGMASMPCKGKLPQKNQSRKSAVSLNYYLSPRLDFEGTGPKEGDIFALLLCARHQSQPGKIEEVAVGIIDSNYDSFLYYDPVEDFIAGYSEKPKSIIGAHEPDPESSKSGRVKAKKIKKVYVPPESNAEYEQQNTNKKE